jgi:D-alanine-D-alanine ligase
MDILVAAGREETDRTDVVDVLRCRESVLGTLGRLGHRAVPFDVTPGLLDAPGTLEDSLRGHAPDIVFNLFEGFANDAGAEVRFVSFLERSGFRFTGNRAAALAACLDKAAVKTALAARGIPVPEGTLVRSAADLDRTVRTGAVFIKPRAEDGNVGIDERSYIPAGFDDRSFRDRVLEKLALFPQGVIVEEFIHGTEYSVGCLGSNERFETVGVSVMEYSLHPGFTPFYTYEAKWNESAAAYRALTPRVGTPIPPELGRRIELTAEAVREALGLSSYFRIDMREKDGRLHVLDVNPNPDINTDSGLLRQAYTKGYDYDSFIGKILECAAAAPGRDSREGGFG